MDLDNDGPKPFVERSTAYRKTDYNPATALNEQRDLDADGLPKQPCCLVRGLAQLGVEVGRAGHCIDTHEP